MSTLQQNWNKRMEVALHIIIWVFTFLTYGLIFAQFTALKISFIRAISNVIALAIVFYTSLRLVNLYWEKKKYGQFTLFSLLLILIASGFRAGVNFSLPISLEKIAFTETKIFYFFAAIITNGTVMVIAVFYQMLYNRYQNEKQNLSIINEQREAQLQALRAQINPHFLFNTLNNIYSLAVVESQKTAEMVLKLSKLLRYVIYDGREAQVSLQKETEQINEFIGLFQMRREEPAHIEFTQLGVEEHQQIEPMILIPFLENGFKHGDFDTNPSAFLKADLQVKNNTLDFQIRNSKNDHNQQKDQQGGVGLDNIRKRLALKYKGQYQLDIQDQKDQFFVHFKLQLANGE